MATLQDLMIRVGIDTDRVKKGARSLGDTLSKNFAKLDNVAGSAIKTMAGVSGVIPLAAGAAGGVAALATSFAAAGAAAGVFGAVVSSTIGEVSENATKVEDLADKIRLYGRSAELAGKYGLEAGDYASKQAKAMLELEARLSLLPKSERDATMAFIRMKNSWKDFVDDNKPATFAFLEKGYGLIGNAVGRLQPLYDIGAAAANRLVAKMETLVNGGFIERLAARARPALASIMDIMFNLGTTFGKIFGKMGDAQGQKMLDWLVEVTARWAEWANATEKDTGINKFVDYMTTNGPKLFALLSDIATAAFNIVKALSPFAPISMAVAGALAQIVAAIPPDWITAIVAGFIAYSAALKVWAAWQAIATAVQWAQNTAMWAWPGTWIIAGILLLIGVIILIATKTTWFQTIWDHVWSFMKRIGAWFAGPFANFFVALYNKIKNGLSSAYDWMLRKWNSLIAFFKSIPGKVSGAFGSMWDSMKDGFRRAINWIISKWNGLNFKIPSISVFGQTFGGGTIGVPNIPQLAQGAVVRARQGGTLVNVGEGGEDEAVVPLSRMPDVAQGRSDRPIVLQVVPGGEMEFRRWINKTIRVKGPLGA